MSTPDQAPTSSSPTSSQANIAISTLQQTLVGPVLFVSFLVSLLVVDRQTSASVFKSPSSPSSDDPKRSGSPKPVQQYYHSHQRKLARRDFDEAFAMRGRVIAAMGVSSVLFLGLVVWSVVRFGVYKVATIVALGLALVLVACWRWWVREWDEFRR